MNTIYVFKTSVETDEQVQRLAPLLNAITAIARWNFDLQDRDRILRMEAKPFDVEEITNQLKQAGFYCEELSDD